MQKSSPKVAIIHEYLVKYGGAERVLEALLQLYPKATVHTLLYDRDSMSEAIQNASIVTSKLNRKRWAHTNLNRARFVMPFHIEGFDLSEYDLVISSAHSFAKGVITRPETLHICYCHTPTRYLWHQSEEASRHVGGIFRRFLPLGMAYFRIWDYAAAQRPDYYLCNSKAVQSRIQKFYRREAVILHPPVRTEAFTPKPWDSNLPLLVVGRLEPHKRIDLVVDAATSNKWRLVVVGTGSQLAFLKRRAGPTVEFLGFVADQQLPKILQESSGLVFPQEEDFGITAIEALAAGRPVIAYAGGSAKEILSGKEAVFFAKPTVGALEEAVATFRERAWNPKELAQAAARFSTEAFQNGFKKQVDRFWNQHMSTAQKGGR